MLFVVSVAINAMLRLTLAAGKFGHPSLEVAQMLMPLSVA